MRLDQMRQSDNVEDRRGSGGGQRLAVGGGLGGVIIVIIVILLGGNPQQLLQGGAGGPPISGGGGGGVAVPNPAQDKAADVVTRVLGDTEDVWTQLFRQMGSNYKPPTLVLFSGETQTSCGMGTSATGPFYCPADQCVYIDLDFFQDLSDRFGAPGDFAQAYVIAHEVGHHVQNLLGTSDKVHAARERLSEAEYNKMSVKLELQADFYAGVWAHHANKVRHILEAGDVDEALRCAAAIGDDRLQKQARGRVVPDSFTHGTSEQRARWFRKGLETGDLRQGDTFATDKP